MTAVQRRGRSRYIFRLKRELIETFLERRAHMPPDAAVAKPLRLLND
jgi:hypothetical protein